MTAMPHAAAGPAVVVRRPVPRLVASAPPCRATYPARHAFATARAARTGRGRFRWAGGFGAAVAMSGAVMMGLLPLADPALNPVSMPLSSYALGPARWLFDAAVATIAAGLCLILIALVGGAGFKAISPDTAAWTLCAAALVTLMVFPDVSADGAPTTVGWIHWGASMVAFDTLPIAPLLVRRRQRGSTGCHALATVARWFAVMAIALLVVFVAGSAVDVTTSLPVWHLGGAIERALAVAELGALFAMGAWAWRGCPRPASGRPLPAPPIRSRRSSNAALTRARHHGPRMITNRARSRPSGPRSWNVDHGAGAPCTDAPP